MRSNIVLSSVIAAITVCVIILSLVPPVGRDDLVHHLAVPKLYLKHGGIYEIPSLSFSYYPMNLDLLYMIPLYFGNDIAPKLIHFGFGLMTAGLIFHYLRRRLDVGYALIAVILFLSVPIIIKISSNAYVDSGLVFFSTSALLLLLKWREQQFGLKYLILSAIFCGLALGTKYNALIIFFLLTAFVFFLYARYSSIFSVIKSGIIYILISLIVFSPWMIRNWHWKKNPIYPLYDGVFNPKPVSETSDAPKKSYGLLTFRSVVYDESGWEIAALPLRIFFREKTEMPNILTAGSIRY
ncbi:MAG: phospholipid carrier-dependent glycosyltransferase [Desulfobacteraceae bacterium]|nr:phospholipid carrier-dependent glycosyltransferase [Desulfobacteraceae bacterium]